MALIQQYAGRSRYFDLYQAGPHTLMVAIPCLLADRTDEEVALLDTGAQWCVLPPATAEDLGHTAPADTRVRLATRFGTITGYLERIPVVFPAETGQSLTVEATWFVSPEWPGPLVIGWKGCLERLRFALDPGEEAFYFGAV